jgi:Na+/H+ antiporter NhaD/arsenite permease-like protein
MTNIVVLLSALLVADASGQSATDRVAQVAAANDAPNHDGAANHDDAAHHDGAANHDGAGHAKLVPPPLWTVIPFALLLGAIAILPLIHRCEHFWESNRNKLLVAAALGAVVVLYFLLGHEHPIDRHFPSHAVVDASEAGPSWEMAGTLLGNALLGEFVPFIVLLFALYTISGGIRIQGDLPAHPGTNVTFITIGGLLASFIGTTGAAMLLIRPLLETNAERKRVAHTVVFFIFVVCNCGGLLLPLGDPPLFLGYLKGVPFFWTLKLWAPWLLTNALLILVYWAWDQFHAYPREAKSDIVRDETQIRPLRIRGLWPNAPLLLGVIACVAFLDPSKLLPGTNIRTPIFLREGLLLALVGLSLALGDKQVRRDNRFNYGAILEVAALFLGIFICMQPPIMILNVEGSALGLQSATHFFWGTGLLSSVLDNAPTYVVFFETARAIGGADPVAATGVPSVLLVAISLGAVFMGANTYIGNGPNFMVKAIAEGSGVRMPSFFGYLAYSGGVLIPVFLLVTALFFIDGAPLKWLIE